MSKTHTKKYTLVFTLHALLSRALYTSRLHSSTATSKMAASRVAALAALLHSAQAGLKVTELYSGAGDANGESM
jgi:hypothetical protein